MLQNIAELKSKTLSQNSVAESCESYDSDEEYNLNENNPNTFEVSILDLYYLLFSENFLILQLLNSG
jgi:hypothetical protein